jgi:hypothetical protein
MHYMMFCSTLGMLSSTQLTLKRIPSRARPHCTHIRPAISSAVVHLHEQYASTYSRNNDCPRISAVHSPTNMATDSLLFNMQHAGYRWNAATIQPIQVLAELTTIPGYTSYFSATVFVTLYYIALAWVSVFVGTYCLSGSRY